MHCNDSRLDDEAPEPRREPTAIYEASDDESATMAVTTALSSASQTDRCALDPLYKAVDTEALDSLFGPRGDGASRDSEGHVSFDYGPYRVRVEVGGTAVVYESE